jgi:hypothetical protein
MNFAAVADAVLGSWKRRFGADPEVPSASLCNWRDDRPWKRGTYREEMEPERSLNYHGTLCSYCGDWINDRAFYKEHGHTPHRPLQGSWNWLHPGTKRRDPDELQPGHTEWIEDIRDYADRSTRGRVLFSGTGPSIDPCRDCAFHSEEEARAVLEPFGCRVYWNKNSGWMIGGVCSGQWSMSGSSAARDEYATRAQVTLNV